MMKSMTLPAARALGVGLLAAIASHASAQGWPSEKPIRFIVPWAPGGGADTASRLIQQPLSQALGQQIVIDNRGGAAGNIGASVAARSPADGYTIVFAYSGTHAINPSLYRKMPFKESDFDPVIWLAAVPQMIVVHPSVPVKTVGELVAFAKKHPGELTYGSSGNGAINHLAGELFKTRTGTNIVHVPYKGGGPAAVALLSGEVALVLGEPASMLGYIRAGKLRALAVTSGKRSLGVPDLPTAMEAGIKDYDVTSWNGILAPAGTPKAIVGRLNAELNKIIAESSMRDRMLKLGYEPVGGPPERFGEHIRAEIKKWAPVVKSTGLAID